jgi:hypothetical protein
MDREAVERKGREERKGHGGIDEKRSEAIKHAIVKFLGRQI